MGSDTVYQIGPVVLDGIVISDAATLTIFNAPETAREFVVTDNRPVIEFVMKDIKAILDMTP